MKRRITMGLYLLSILIASIIIISCSKNSVGGDVVEDDGIGPAPVTDLAVLSFSDTSVTLTWTASGDDSTSGTADRYDLRISNRIIHYANFDSATQVNGLPAPQIFGTTEQFQITNLETDSTYYFALRVYDEEKNYNGISNIVSATCFNDFMVNIPDNALLAAIRTRINKPSGNIMKSDLINLADLNVSDLDISDLTGLEYCINL